MCRLVASTVSHKTKLSDIRFGARERVSSRSRETLRLVRATSRLSTFPFLGLLLSVLSQISGHGQ